MKAPSPNHWTTSEVKVSQSCPTLCDTTDYTVHRILWARILEWRIFPFSRRSSQPRDQTQVSHIAGRLYQLSHKGSPRILQWVSLSLLQGIFPTLELNLGLPHCRWILYQLSFQRSPDWTTRKFSKARNPEVVENIMALFHQ